MPASSYAIAAAAGLSILLFCWVPFFWFGRRSFLASATPAILCGVWSLFFGLLAFGVYALAGCP